MVLLNAMLLELKNLVCGYTPKPVLGGVDLKLESGELLCLLGPNGSGKTALLKTVAGLLPALGGRIVVEGRDLGALSSSERSRHIAYVPQAHAPLFAFSVRDVVVMGRTARWPLWSGPGDSDWLAADKALERVGLGSFASRRYTEISGGERQMVLVARALAQEASFLVLDEPASSLDIGNQAGMLRTLRELTRSGIGVLMATHHPEHALRCATRVAVVRDRKILRQGDPEETLTAECLLQAYGVPFLVSSISIENHPPIRVCVPQAD